MHRDDLPIPDPCHASWDAMDGDDRRRFCDACSQHVHDLSAMTEAEASEVLVEPGVCVRYTVGAGDRIQFRSRRRFIAGLAIASGALVSLPAAASVAREPGEPGLMAWAWDKVSAWWAGGCPIEGEPEMVLGQVAFDPVQLEPAPPAEPEATAVDDLSQHVVMGGAVAPPEPPPRKLQGKPIAPRPTGE